MKGCSRFYRAVMLASFAAVAATTSTNAVATLVSGSFEGAIYSGYDLGGYFGTPGGDLTGQALSGSFTYDTELAPLPWLPGQYQSGGAGGWLASSITINGASWAFDLGNDPAAYSDLAINLSDDPDPDSFTVNISQSLFTDVFLTQSLSFFALGGLSDFVDGLALPEHLSWDGVGFGEGYLSVDLACFGAPECSPQSFNGAFFLSSLTIAPTAVPEPSSMGLIGLGMAGIWLSRRRRRAASVAVQRR